MTTFLKTLEEQRWDDHRYYHHSRINQSLHLVSAMCFLCAYVLLFTYPVAAALIGWLLAMTSRQLGHFFFEPKGYDQINRATHEYKESIKVGYNLRRKVVLLGLWALSVPVLMLDPTLLGFLASPAGLSGFLANLSVVWIGLGVGAILFRTIHLFFLKDVMSGLAWFTKIATDPFHDIKLYYKAPLQVLRGEMFDPIIEEEAPAV